MPADDDEAHQAVREVSDYCRDYCPVRMACVEDACGLFRLEKRALGALGYRRDDAVAAVGVQSQSIIAL